MVQLIFRRVISWLLLQLGILNALCFEKTYKDEHVDFGGWEQIRNTDTFWLIILTVLNPHSTFKSKSCGSFYSVQLARTKNNLESRLCVTYRVLFSLGPWAMKTRPHPWGISTCLAVVTSLDLGNFGLKLWMSERVLTDKRVLLQHLEASQVMPVVFFFFKKQQQKKTACQWRRCEFNSWVKKIPWRRK